MNELTHYGIKGMHWGVRRYDYIPKGRKRSSKSNEEKEKFHLSEKQKKALVIGGATVGTLLLVYGTVKLQPQLANKMYKASVKKTVNKIDFDNLGPEIVRKTKTSMSGDIGGLTNPLRRKNNCKDVSEAVLKRWLGVDPGAVAGDKTVKGNLHDFIEAKQYNKAGVHWINEMGSITPTETGDNAERVSKAILKKFNDGDCGFITVSWNPEIHPIKPGQEDGHAFNWFVDKGKVLFMDDQPDTPVKDASKYFKDINSRKEIEIAKITKEAFN